MTGPAFFALDDAPFYMVRLSDAVAARYESGTTTKLTTRKVRLTNPTREATPLTRDVQLVNPVSGMTTQEDANKHFVERLEKLEENHDDTQGHAGITRISRARSVT